MVGCHFRLSKNYWSSTAMDVNFICWEQPG